MYTKSFNIVDVSWCNVKALKSAGRYLSTQRDINYEYANAAGDQTLIYDRIKIIYLLKTKTIEVLFCEK